MVKGEKLAETRFAGQLPAQRKLRELELNDEHDMRPKDNPLVLSYIDKVFEELLEDFLLD